ncbi:MAG: PTS system mannose/fructose/sorbose family transporter subunit IID [Candidatus Latescibacterota bacterium]
MDKVTNQLGAFDLFKVSLRILFLQGVLHPKGMQNIGFASAVSAGSVKLAGEKAADELVRKHMGFFNCNPNFTSLVVGGALKLEEERLAGKPIDDHDIEYFKKAVSSPLAAMGDMMFLGSFKPLALTFACIFAIYQSLTGLLAVFLIYNSIIVTCRFWGVYFGYSKGWELVDFFAGPGFQRVLNAVQIAGACVGGALTAIVLYALFKGGIGAFFPRGPLSPQSGAPMLMLGGGVVLVTMLLLRRDLSSSWFAVCLLPVSALLALLFN